MYEQQIIKFVMNKDDKLDNLPKDTNSTVIQVHESNLKLILDGAFLVEGFSITPSIE